MNAGMPRQARTTSLTTATLLAALALVAAVNDGVVAQNALGRGDGLRKDFRGLDGNTARYGGRGNPTGRDVREQARLNDAIATGNVGGGRQFRGNVNYTAPFEFRGSTGSNASYNFYRETYRAGSATTQGLRGIESLQKTFNESVGRDPGASPILQREARGSAVGDYTGLAPLSVDPARSPVGALRSLAKSASDRASEPDTYRLSSPDGTARTLGASSLRGVYEQVIAPPAEGLAGGLQRAPGLGAPPTGRPASTTLTERLGEKLSDKVSEEARPDPLIGRVPTSNLAYERILLEMRGETPERIEKEMKELEDAERGAAGRVTTPGEPKGAKEQKPESEGKRELSPDRPRAAGEEDRPLAPGERAPEQGDFRARLDRLRERLIMPQDERSLADAEHRRLKAAQEEARAEAEAKGENGDVAAKRVASEQARELRESAKGLLGKSRARVKELIVPKADPSGYTRHMTDGQRALSDGKWFDAEESFSRAMLFRDADPIAAVGRVHAQMGAGMFLSAASNLRALLRAHPEMAAVTYESTLLPRAQRLQSLAEALRESAQRNDAFGRDAALLLAYLGFQTGAATDINAGLEAIQRINEYLAAEADPLDEVLRAVWLP